ncbi:Zinc finger FYVE domain-containing protein 26 [Halotydeus destructor]|nr:Zinc finger FYVE domain-containing protein 26 [Halotydeus destructor]
MRVDLIGTLCSLLCPAIPVVTKPEDFGADFYLVDTNFPALCDLIECYLTGSMRKNESIMVMNHFGEDESAYEIRALMKPELIAYFRSKSVLLVDILRLLKLYEPRRESLSNGDNQPAFSENCVLLKWIKLVQTLFTNGTKDESALVALALSPKISVSNWIVMRSLEDHATKKHLLHLYELFRFLQIKTPSSSLHALRIAVLSKLALEYEEVKYVLQIEDARTKTDLLIELIDESPAMSDSELVVRAIQATIASIEKYTVSDDMSAHLKERLQNKVRLVNCYSKIAELSGLNIWKDAYEILSDADILTILKTKRQYNLALQWNSIKKNSKATDREVERLRLELLILAHSDKDNRSELEKLLKNTDDLEYLIEKTLPQIENWDAKEILLSFANQSDSYGNKLYADHLDGIRLIKLLPKNSRSSYAQLMSQPMLIIEQLLMNTEYDVLVEAIAALKSVNCDELIETYARKAVTIELYEEPNSSLVGSDTTFISSSFALEAAAFTMPPSVPTKDQWIADNKVTHCMLCKVEKFSTLFNRRHHCRRCGRVVCASCSQKLMLISEVNAFARVRVCDDCYIQTRAYNDRKESINSCSSSLKLSQWALTLDETQNAITREEFCYEAAPSSSLCLSILRLHSQRTRCVSLFLDQMIKKLFDVLISPQVDYGLVISIIKTLLMSAKVICEEFNELRSQIHHIDLMLSRIDIVKMLVDQNCINKDLINCIIFNESQQSMVKLQEKLLEMERFELALNIGMKHGLDVKGIWKAWAMVCLKNGRFMEARQKFRYVMVETSTNQQVVSLNSKHIHDIVETLKKQKRIPSVRTHLRDRVKAIKNSQSSLLTSRELSSQVAVEGSDIPLVVYDEALYYLTKYGSKEDSIKFFSKFNLSKQAVEVFLSENSAVSLINSFVTDFFLVALRRGNLDSVFTLIRSLDPTLSKSWKYLIATCKHLSKHRQYSVLHTVQLFMGDYLRAAMTQINYFYLRKPLNNYTELHNRADHLKRAIVHCKQNLEVKGHSHPGCFSLPQEHVQRQIRTMNLQLEIASVFCEKKVKGVITFPDELDTSMDSSMDSLQISDGVHSPPSLKSPLTLLDNSKGRKTQLAALVAVFAGDSVNESFRYTQQIIKDHRLDAPFVYRLTGRTILAVKPSRAIELLSQLLHCVQGTSPDSEASTVCDDILGACLRSCTNQELSEPLIKMMNSDVNKIDAYILSGKLKSAYLLAVRLERTVDVKRIMLLAERSEQEGVRKICHMWLQRKKGDSQ